ncbi:MAG: hypothetical protein ABFD50_08155 [Smithella sp.]
MDIDYLKTLEQIASSPFGAAFLMGFILWKYDQRAQKREDDERASRQELANTFEKTVSDILTRAEITQKALIEKAESTERLCEARYTILLKQVIDK